MSKRKGKDKGLIRLTSPPGGDHFPGIRCVFNDHGPPASSPQHTFTPKVVTTADLRNANLERIARELERLAHQLSDGDPVREAIEIARSLDAFDARLADRRGP